MVGIRQVPYMFAEISVVVYKYSCTAWGHHPVAGNGQENGSQT